LKSDNLRDSAELSRQIKSWAQEMGFQDVGISDIDLQQAEQRLLNWLNQKWHGQMQYMAKHGTKRSQPQSLLPDTLSIISVSMQYRVIEPEQLWHSLAQPNQGYISCYALGRDYHKTLRKRLQALAKKIEHLIGPFGYRVFCDSAPVLEKAIAEKAGLGWIGKHSNLINKKSGSWFFLAEIYTDLPLPHDEPAQNHCGDCRSCLDACPTEAIVAPYQVDARRCISYHTIELRGSIPITYRRKMGNRIYGCDDCQLVCPWNRFSRPTREADFQVRHELDHRSLLDLLGWSKHDFESRLQGSAIRRIGYLCWQRNIVVALGNAGYHADITRALSDHLAKTESPMLKSHLLWSILEQRSKKYASIPPANDKLTHDKLNIE